MTFQWGLDETYGTIDTVAEHPVTAANPVAVSMQLAGLTPNTDYHFRLRVVDHSNGDAILNGADSTFRTLAQPLATTDPAGNISTNSATLNGRVNPQGDATTVEFEWGQTTSYGNSKAADQSPLAAGITVEVAVSTVLGGLAASTDYHYRVKATNGSGTTFGLDQAFSTQAVAGPSAPANVVMYGGSGAAAITWDPNPAGENVNKYTVYRNTINNSSTAIVVKDVNVPYTHYVDYPATTDREYWYWVSATDQNSQEGAKSIGVSDWVDPPLAHGGGPDTFGYKWFDSDTTGGPSVEWTDITSAGTQLNLGDDDSSQVGLPFSFPFYGIDYTDIQISSNGYLTFDLSGPGGLAGNEDPGTEIELHIPSDSGANNFIAAFWADLNPDPTNGGGTIHYYNDAANNRFIVQYTNVPFFQEPQTAPGKSGKDGASVMPVGKFDTGGGKAGLDISGSDPQDALIQLSPGQESAQMATDFTFQVQLYDDGAILFQYLAMNGLTDAATVGIENSAGDDGLAAVEWDFLVKDNYAIGFKPPGLRIGSWAFTAGATGITSNSATLVAEVMPDGVETEVFFDYWDEADQTILAIPQIPILVSGTAIVPVSATLSGLIAGRTYYFQVMAIQAG
ncbi:MAG: hypothetical protein IIA60_14920, partial [Candidatus Marinimicrobia bacterium]|nr:hypothetical protein [Candidatus Neomarinimicrobiota bacterium]